MLQRAQQECRRSKMAEKTKIHGKKDEKPAQEKKAQELIEESRREEKMDNMEKAEKKIEEKKEDKKEEKKPEAKAEKPKLVKKDEAIAKANNLHVSKKQCMYICDFIKGKSIDDSIAYLEEVIKLKKIIPFKGEIPHRRGKGVMSGRYPVNASKIFIPILKNLKGNILVNQMDLDNSRIYFASASWASRPSKRGGGRFKRANIILKAKELVAPNGGASRIGVIEPQVQLSSKRGTSKSAEEAKK